VVRIVQMYVVCVSARFVSVACAYFAGLTCVDIYILAEQILFYARHGRSMWMIQFQSITASFEAVRLWHRCEGQQVS